MASEIKFWLLIAKKGPAAEYAAGPMSLPLVKNTEEEDGSSSEEEERNDREHAALRKVRHVYKLPAALAKPPAGQPNRFHGQFLWDPEN